MTRLAIVGGAGRMGQVMAEWLAREEDLSVVALVDRRSPAQTFGALAVLSLDDLDPVDVDVVVDFSTPEGVAESAQWCQTHAKALLVGATGLGEPERASLEEAARHVRVVVSANFAIGAVLAERFAAMAAPYFERVEVIELHHDRKVDAPSGTALATARAVAAARSSLGRPLPEDATQRHSVAGSRGADVGGVRVHAVRLPGLVAHEEILLGGPGEGLTIRHDSYDRASFVPGVLVALRAMGRAPGLSQGLGEFL